MALDGLQSVLINDFGGLNTGVHPTKIGENEFVRLKNWVPYGDQGKRELRRRGGTKRITGQPYQHGTEQLTSFWRYKSTSGVWALVVGTTSSIALLDAGAQNLRTISAQGEYTASLLPWTWAQYKDIVYGFRDGPGMVRIQLSPFESVAAAGINKPPNAPTLADGSAGAIPAADFKGVVTCYNSLTDEESNPSDASATLTHAGGKKIAWSNIPVCPEAQVNARRLWRTLPNQTGAYFLVTTINDNFTTSYTEDNSTVDLLGKAVSFKHGMPPVNLLMGVVWNDCMWASDGTYLYKSQIGHMEGFDSSDTFAVFPDDGSHITGLLAAEDRLYIQKNDKIHYLTGTSRGTYDLHTLDPENGGWAAHSIKFIEGRLFWLDFDGLYTSSGGPGQPVGDVAMQRYFGAIDRDLMYVSHMTHLTDKNLLLITLPMRAGVLDDITNPRMVTLVYNYRTNAWSIWEIPHATATLNFMDAILDRFDEPVLWAVVGYHLYTNDDPGWNLDEACDSAVGGRDTPLPITAELLTKDFGSDEAGYFSVRRLRLLFDPINGETLVRLYKNGRSDSVSEAIKTRTLTLSGGVSDWRHYNLSTIGNPGSTFQMQMVYDDPQPLRLQAFGFDLSKVNRQRRAE